MAIFLALSLAVLSGGLAAGKRAHRLAATLRSPAWWPRAALIVPVTGNRTGMAGALESLALQDYPGFRMIIALRSPADPAAATAGALAAAHPHVRLALAGAATRCAQKNGNLLAGIAAVEREIAVFVFADAGHLAAPGWLKGMVHPLAVGASPVSSGYHRIAFTPGDSLTAGAWSLVVHLLGALRGVPRLRMPWGGATAITRALFERLSIAALWGGTVVDDVTLGARLRQADITPALPTGPLLLTPLAHPSWGAFLDWLTRQLAFLKFIHPGEWIALTLVGTLFSLALLASVLIGIGQFPGLAPPILACLALIAAAFVYFGPADGEGKMRFQPLAVLAALVAALWCQARLCRSMEIAWAGIRYRVAFGGRVVSLQPLEPDR
jgi:hypothetical protein